MSEIKTEYVDFEIAGKIYKLSLTLNVIDAFQEKYGNLNNVFKETANLKEIAWIMTQFINEAIENHNDDNPDDKWSLVDEKWVGRKLNKDNMAYTADVFLKVFGVSMPKIEGEPDPNPQAAQ